MPNSTLNPTFPQKLFFLMDLESSDIITWLPHGLAFKILDYKRFGDETIPKYFRHTKLTSFQRQLNLYGFRRISKGQDNGAYFHAKFQRGRADLVAEIRRLPGKPILATFSRADNNNNKDGIDALDCDDAPGGNNKRSLPRNDMDNYSSDINIYPYNPYNQIDSNTQYEEQKSNPTTLCSNSFDYHNQILPANKMSKVSMHHPVYGMLGMKDEMHQKQQQQQLPQPQQLLPHTTQPQQPQNCPPNFRIRWIPVLENSTMGMKDYKDVPSTPSMGLDMDMNMMMMMNSAGNNRSNVFAFDNMSAEDTKIQPPESLITSNLTNTILPTSTASSSTTSSEMSDWPSTSSGNFNKLNAAIPDDSNFVHEFDELCGDFDFDSLLDSDTVECLQDLLSV